MKKIVLITGVTKGLGKELLKVFDQNGWIVLGCSRTKSDIQKLQNEFSSRHYFKALDISSNLSVLSFRDEILKANLKPDILINNASIINKPNSIWEVSSEEFNRIIEINLIGAFNFIQAFVSALSSNNALKIINISSYWGKYADPLVGPYCASKFGLEGLTLSLSKELPPSMLAVLVDPGVMQTEMLRICSSEEGFQKAPTAKYCAKKLYSKLITLQHSDNGSTLFLDN